MLALLEKDRGKFDRAFELADALPDDIPPQHAWRRPELRATILLRRAIDTRKTSKHWHDDAERAVAAFDEALGLVRSSGIRARLQVRREVARYVADADDLGATRAFVNLLRLTPDDPYEIANLASILPDDGLDATATTWLRAWLRRLAIALAKGDPAFRERQDSILSAEEGR